MHELPSLLWTYHFLLIVINLIQKPIVFLYRDVKRVFVSTYKEQAYFEVEAQNKSSFKKVKVVWKL